MPVETPVVGRGEGLTVSVIDCVEAADVTTGDLEPVSDTVRVDTPVVTAGDFVPVDAALVTTGDGEAVSQMVKVDAPEVAKGDRDPVSEMVTEDTPLEAAGEGDTVGDLASDVAWGLVLTLPVTLTVADWDWADTQARMHDKRARIRGIL